MEESLSKCLGVKGFTGFYPGFWGGLGLLRRFPRASGGSARHRALCREVFYGASGVAPGIRVKGLQGLRRLISEDEVLEGLGFRV